MPQTPFDTALDSWLTSLRQRAATKDAAKYVHDPDRAEKQREFDTTTDLQERMFKNSQEQEGIKNLLGVGGLLDKYPGTQFKQGVSGTPQMGTSAEGNVGIPGVGPTGRTSPETPLQQRPTEGFNVGQTTGPTSGAGPAAQPDSVSNLANFFRQQFGAQEPQGPPAPADTLQQQSPGVRQMPTQAGPSPSELMPGAAGGGGGVTSPAFNEINLPGVGNLKIPLQQPVVKRNMKIDPSKTTGVVKEMLDQMGITEPMELSSEDAEKWMSGMSNAIFKGMERKDAAGNKSVPSEMEDRNAAAMQVAQQNGVKISDPSKAYSELISGHPDLAVKARNNLTSITDRPDADAQRRMNIALGSLIASGASKQNVENTVNLMKTGIIPTDLSKLDPHARSAVAQAMAGDPTITAPLSPPAQQAVAAGSAALKEIDGVTKLLKETKFKDEGPMFLAGAKARYNTPFESKDDKIIAKLSMDNIMNVGSIMKLGGLRAFPIWKAANEHVPNMWMNSKKVMIERLDNMRDRLTEAIQQETRMTKGGTVLPDNSGKADLDLNQFYHK